MQKVILVIAGLCIMYSCKQIKSETAPATPASVFKHIADSVFELKSTKPADPIAYVIIPNTGCGGCISSVEELFADYVKKDLPVRFVLTNISSIKSLRQTFGDSVVMRNNVYTDQSNMIYSRIPQLTQIYPMVFYVGKPGEAVKCENVSPETPDALAHFTKYVDSSMKARHL